MINSRKRAGTNPKDSLTEQVQSRLSNSSFLESSIHQSLLQELGLSDNLAFLQEHGENAIYKTISSRYDTNVTYTFAGPLLISIYKETDIFSQFAIDKREDYSTNNSSLPPHLYSISMKSYFQLKDTNQNQVVSLLGLSGSGKTFSAIHLIDHLIYLSNNTEHNIQTKLHKEFFDSIHAGIQALHIMGSVMTEENKESTCCGMVSVLHFDSENRVAGANIRAKLLDTTLPSTNGRSFDILHALLTNTKPTLQNLGLVSHNSRLLSFTSPADINQKVHDSEILKRFLQNLGNLGLVRKDINHLVELLAAVIHLYDINYAPTSFVRAGQRETTQYLPRHRVSVQKICKLLGTTEEKFNEAFADSNSKSDAESKVADMGRYLYGLAFDWLVIKINKQLDLKAKEIIKNRITYEMKTCSSLSLPKQREKLRSLNDNCHKLKTISIVDFPGFRNNFSLGSFCSNLAFECLNFYASNSYMSLLASLAGEKVSMKFLEVPKSRYLVDFSLARDFGLLPNLPTADFDKY